MYLYIPGCTRSNGENTANSIGTYGENLWVVNVLQRKYKHAQKRKKINPVIGVCVFLLVYC